jgi:hypothetical protein
MRSRADIQNSLYCCKPQKPVDSDEWKTLVLEVLLDIRELLINQNSKGGNR